MPDFLASNCITYMMKRFFIFDIFCDILYDGSFCEWLLDDWAWVLLCWAVMMGPLVMKPYVGVPF